jgi:hypothetical protein
MPARRSSSTNSASVAVGNAASKPRESALRRMDFKAHVHATLFALTNCQTKQIVRSLLFRDLVYSFRAFLRF